jgi:pimeloyl-ACP methyl ester carboxylesterase
MATYVLVPGFWLGGWAWAHVSDPLRKLGHRVYSLTLTGLGERVHLGGPETDLDTHFSDVVNVFRYEDLHDVILVGHSYAGIVITGVAARIPERIARLVYVDTAPLPDGVAHADFYPPDRRTSMESTVAQQGDGWRLPFPPWAELEEGNILNGLDTALRKEIEKRVTAQPFNASQQTIRLPNPAWKQIPKTGVFCTYTVAQVHEAIASGAPMFSELAGPSWEYVELPTGHWPMFSRPKELTEILARIQ